VIEDPEMVPTKRIADLDSDDTLKLIFMIPRKTYKELGKIAFDKEVSKASIVRDAVREYLRKSETPPHPLETNSGVKISDENLNTILDHCTTYYGGFEIDGEDGFVQVMKRNNNKLEDLTPEQWKRVQEKLEIGYAGYFSPPEPKEFAERFKDLKPTPEQFKWLSNTEEEAQKIKESEE
jgi:hypothetical protein